MPRRHLPYPKTEDKQLIQSGRETEILEITTSGSHQQIVFTKYVKEFVLFNNGATSILLYDASDGTIGFPLLAQAMVTIRLSGKEVALWVKAASGTPKLVILGIR